MNTESGAVVEVDPWHQVESFCLFIGYPRSGHSLVGSLIDAHADAVIAHELDALSYVAKQASKEELFAAILDNATRFGREGRQWTGYDYSVPGANNGRFDKLQVIGDKKGGMALALLAQNEELLTGLHHIVGVPLRLLHVVRNPFDNITTISRRSELELEKAMDYYFSLVETAAKVRRQCPQFQCLDLRHETLVDDPRGTLQEILDHLGLEPLEDYFENCAQIVYRSPNKSRRKGAWKPALIRQVEAEMVKYPFLAGYTFDD